MHFHVKNIITRFIYVVYLLGSKFADMSPYRPINVSYNGVPN